MVAGYVTNTSLVPAENVVFVVPPALEARTVSRDSNVPEAVYVPMPTSHSLPVWPAMVKYELFPLPIAAKE
jgi:hypothetical protein